jgi:hypothetical protein
MTQKESKIVYSELNTIHDFLNTLIMIDDSDYERSFGISKRQATENMIDHIYNSMQEYKIVK